MNKKRYIIIISLLLVLVLAMLIYSNLSTGHTAKSIAEPKLTDTKAKSEAETSKPSVSEAVSTPQVKNAVPVETVPDFSVTDIDGNIVSLSDYFGKPLVINFWATWCGPCKSELPAFDAAFAEHGEDISFLMVNLTDRRRDTLEGVKAFIEKEGYSFPVYFDTELSAAYAYNISSIPMTVFVNPDGSLMDYKVGMMSESKLTEYISALMLY